MSAHDSSPPVTSSRRLLIVGLSILVGLSGWIGYNELRASWFQAHYFSSQADQFSYQLQRGPSTAIRFPGTGPYDQRLGYCNLPHYTHLLTHQGFVVAAQVHMSPGLLHSPLTPLYAEKDQAGLTLLDQHQQVLYAYTSPTRIYRHFVEIPPLLVHTLLFIEDKELLDPRYPMRNPAVNWSRLDRAVAYQALHLIDHRHETPGASTLATQIEKYRHSPEGRTLSIHEKFLQMEAASFRSYLNGRDNMPHRRDIVVTYLNTVPLTARAGYGEISGLGDGMWVWYGRDFKTWNTILTQDQTRLSHAKQQQHAAVYKQALSLMIAQRRPSYFLKEGSPMLGQMTNHYLRLLEAAHVISPELLKQALSIPLLPTQGSPPPQKNSFVSHKAENLLRVDLSALLHIPNLYTLDRLDLSAQTTLDGPTQHAVTEFLRQIQDPSGAAVAGLYGHNLLRDTDDPHRLSFSFTLFERGIHANRLRVQTDSLDQPFDINSGARLNLGSTAKLRTLITYLEIITHLHESYANKSRTDLEHISPRDELTRWALTYFIDHPLSGLRDTLEAAMMRPYSGNPAESFFTGGGLQKFENFEPAKDDHVMTVREGFQNSVNLVFVRLMRDIVRYYEVQIEHSGTATDDNRQNQLSQFADREGREFLIQFYKKYQGKSHDEILQTLTVEIHPKPKNLALLFRSIQPEAGLQPFTAFMQAQFPPEKLDSSHLYNLYIESDPQKFTLNDRGYLIGIHPLELWLVNYLLHHPEATLSQAIKSSTPQRQEVYAWLFKTHHKATQDKRIAQIQELEAFQKILADWHRLGYPFGSLTPSYATALGASGDRPDALAKLMGIIINQGMALPIVELQGLHFAQHTPYETDFDTQPIPGIRLLPVEITDIIRQALLEVVQGGTGIRLKHGFVVQNGQPIEIGGKTGTGDQRFVTYGSSGQLISSRAVNRSATFVFLIGDRFFGTITAYVHEPYAADYTFTSALTVQLLKSLNPILQPLIDSPESPDIPLDSPT